MTPCLSVMDLLNRIIVTLYILYLLAFTVLVVFVHLQNQHLQNINRFAVFISFLTMKFYSSFFLELGDDLFSAICLSEWYRCIIIISMSVIK